ncbi:MAG TPA: NADH-quinone oxidoreductase subunit L, partial [Geomonas sp.]|nr:NADH-quinone oxidoreductase subunit L [Geomonas sp.]
MNSLLLIALLPLAGFLVNGMVGRRLPNGVVALIACALPAVSFALTVVHFLDLAAGGTPVVETVGSWVSVAGFQVDLALYFDRLTSVMCLVVTGVGTLIHLYSIGYMSHDQGFARYFAYLNLFLFFMLLLVLGKNLLVLFAGWEGVGIASYLLIGFWFQDDAKTAASLKAFVVNRVGDTGFVLAAFLIWFYAGTLDFAGINAFFGAANVPVLAVNAMALLLLVGASGKSAQIPLHVWLPDAMAGPTPVSALIHAATMVTAGVYLLARLNGLFLHAPLAMTVVTWGGALTALIGASMGVTQFNLKKVLAYSTMSQLGYLFMACGLGAFPVAIFHLYTHAFFKACLFLSAGAVIHALHGEEDMRRMGRLAKRIPFTFGCFLMASLALCGVPPFAGFFSKDEILWKAWSAPGGSPLLWVLASATSALTAFYMFRAILLTFFGSDNVAGKIKGRIHPPTISMTVVLGLLAISSLAAGLIGMPGLITEKLGVGAPFYEFLSPVLSCLPNAAPLADLSLEFALMTVAVGIAACGILFAWLMYGGEGRQGNSPGGVLYKTVSRGYYFDSAYRRLVVRPLDYLSEAVLARRVEPVISGVTLA